jgi:NAD(P)-dependent dehydrogenase (short-subunit alcohol dehydrogenase family)
MKTSTIAQRAARLLSLEGKVAVVTGGASGIGRGIAVRLAEVGAFVAVFDIDERNGRTTAATIAEQGRSGVFLHCDVSRAADCQRATKAVIQNAGRVDVLCHSAGIAIRKDVVELPEDEWDRAVDVTLKSIYLLSHEVVLRRS